MGLTNSPPVVRSGDKQSEVEATGSTDVSTGARPKQRNDERCEVEDGNFGVDPKNAEHPFGHQNLWKDGEDSRGESTKTKKLQVEYEVRLLTKVVAYQGLLQQFSHPQVRADLINEKFGEVANSFNLRALDELRCSVFPQWHGGSLEVSPENFSSAAVQLIKLISDSPDTAPHRSEDASPLTYAEWNETLKMLAHNPYWYDTAAEKRCTHITKEFKSSPTDFKLPSTKLPSTKFPSTKFPSTKFPSTKFPSTKFPSTEFPSTEFPSIKFPSTKLPSMKSTSSSTQAEKIDEIILSSDTSVESDSSCSSSTDANSSDERMSIPHRRAKKRTDKREIVTPPIFQMDGKLHLRSFLSSYESYFKSKFRGDSRDKCQQLEHFLTGDLLNVYKICGGRRLKYDQMKERLLAHFKKQKIGGRAYWRKKFEEASPKSEETLDIFGMRLMELAELAFPKSPREAAKMLRQAFLLQIPHRVREKICDMEKVMKATSGGSQKHLNFSAIMQLAADLQAELPRPHTIMWSDELQKHVPGRRDNNNNVGFEPSNGRQFWSQGHFRHRTPERVGVLGQDRSFSPGSDNKWQGESPDHWQSGRSDYPNQRRSPDMRFNRKARQQSSSRQWTPERPRRQDFRALNKFCSFCGKKNHEESSCWRANNACLICGGEHMMKECSKYNPKFSRSEASN